MTLEVVIDVLRCRGTRGWLVGGTVRDRELRRYSPDQDMVVNDDAAEVARELAARLSCPWFALSARHGAYRVMGPEGHIDVARMRGKSIIDDLGQRDFTVNAMAVPVGSEDLIDPFGGLAHLRERLLVAVSERIFLDDPLRLMRAARFSHVLSLRLDTRLEAMARSQASLLSEAAPERVATEMALTLSSGESVSAVTLWHDLGLLAVVFPELALAQGADIDSLDPVDKGQPAWKADTGLLEQLDEVLEHLEDWFPGSAPIVGERLAQPVDGVLSRPVALRLAALVYKLCPEKAVAVGRRLKLSASAISLLEGASALHYTGRPGQAFCQAVLSRRSTVLFLWNAEPWELEIILLGTAASLGSYSAEPPTELEVVGAARQLVATWADRAIYGAPISPVDGSLLMHELGLEPGAHLGGVLREVRLAWESREVTTRAEALVLARRAAMNDVMFDDA